MQTLETDAEITADGCLRLPAPLPVWLRPGPVHILLVVDSADVPDFDDAVEDFTSPALARHSLSRAYGDDEPEYTLADSGENAADLIR